ncbi:MAG: hypothetical protein LBQ73_06775 [Tannerellaceae bacterium]|jgi:hypothetical protein|nr:hypothetical protein [Tannerellaceae bacterium]
MTKEERAKALGREAAYASAGNTLTDGSFLYGNFGLTKREHFAAMAMQGVIANDYLAAKDTAKVAVGYADALLLELDNE